MKGEIIEIAILQDEYKQEEYRVIMIFKEKPPFKLGDVEVKQ